MLFSPVGTVVSACCGLFSKVLNVSLLNGLIGNGDAY